MKEKARKFVYLNTGNYISYDFLIIFYWAIFIVPYFTISMGITSLDINGVNGESLFPLVSIAIWSLLYWGLVILIKSKHVKKTFELRFLVNGAMGCAISSLVWIFFASWNIMADKPFLKFEIFLWMIPIYILVSVLYVSSVITGVHYGVYAKIKMSSKTGAFLSTFCLFAAACGIIISRILRGSASLKVQHIVMTIGVIILVFVPILAHINFVQYFYCKKCNINCDENGDTTSPKLELQIKEKKKEKKTLKKVPLIIKILIGILSAPIVLFVMLFAVFFIKAIIERL